MRGTHRKDDDDNNNCKLMLTNLQLYRNPYNKYLVYLLPPYTVVFDKIFTTYLTVICK